MRVKKTRQDQRGVYRYPVDVPDGKGGYRRTYNVIRPGEDGVTEVTTVIYGIQKVEDLMNADAHFSARVNQLIARHV